MKTFIEWFKLREAVTEDIGYVLKPMGKQLGVFLYNMNVKNIPSIQPIGDEDPEFTQSGMLVKSHGEETPYGGEIWSVKLHPTLVKHLDERTLEAFKREILPKWATMFKDAGWEVQGPSGDHLGLEVIEPMGHEFLGGH
jgi:hypothetical protein